MATLKIGKPAFKSLEDLGRLIAERAQAEEYKGIRDTIADFIDRFLIEEIKAALASGAVITEEVEVPESILQEIADRMRPAPVPVLPRTLDEELPSVEAAEACMTPPTLPEGRKKRVGNGHKSTKVRPLSPEEKDGIREFFMGKDGCTEDDDAVRYRKERCPEEISPFQISGFLSYLHAEVADGRTALKNLGAYEEWMRGKYDGVHKEMWARYSSPRFVECRMKNEEARRLGLPVSGLTGKYRYSTFIAS